MPLTLIENVLDPKLGVLNMHIRHHVTDQVFVKPFLVPNRDLPLSNFVFEARFKNLNGFKNRRLDIGGPGARFSIEDMVTF